MFSCGFCEIFKNTFFTEHFCTNASDVCNLAKECTPPKLFLILSKSVRPLKVVIWSWQPPEVSCKKTCSQNSQENTCVRVSFLIKLQACGLWPATLLKKRLWYRCFPLNSSKFPRTPFLQNTSDGCFFTRNKNNKKALDLQLIRFAVETEWTLFPEKYLQGKQSQGSEYLFELYMKH